jgi:hypothetical protein
VGAPIVFPAYIALCTWLQAPPPVVGIVVEQQHWSQCDRCQKWRLVPQAVIQSIENSPGTPWFCEMKGGGVTCDTPEDK